MRGNWLPPDPSSAGGSCQSYFDHMLYLAYIIVVPLVCLEWAAAKDHEIKTGKKYPLLPILSRKVSR